MQKDAVETSTGYLSGVGVGVVDGVEGRGTRTHLRLQQRPVMQSLGFGLAILNVKVFGTGALCKTGFDPTGWQDTVS